MATNFSFADGVKLIAAGENCAELEEFGKRFPQLTIAISKVVARAGDDFVELANHFPDFLTAQKVNKVYKEEVKAASADEDSTEDDGAEEPKPKRKPGRPRKAAASDDDAADEEKPKRKPGRPRKNPEPEPEPEPVEDDADEDDGEDSNGYADMTAKQLYTECKKRGLDVEPKKAAKVYIDALEADDAGTSDDASDDDDDDDWDI